MKNLYLILVFFTLVSCSTFSAKNDGIGGEFKPQSTTNEFANWKKMVGYWYGEIPTREKTIRRWLIDRREDGTFTIQFAISDEGKIDKTQVEAGLWGISGPIYFTMTREFIHGDSAVAANVRDPNFYDAYKIISFNGETFVYESVVTGDRYQVKRVTKDFKL